MFTTTTTYENNAGWDTIEEALTEINELMTATKTEQDQIKLDELESTNDLIWGVPTLSSDGVTYTSVITASQHALDVMESMSADSGATTMYDTIQKFQSDWTPVVE